jgi:hypothetical protein
LPTSATRNEHVELFVEAQRGQVADPHLRDHQVKAAGLHRLVAAERLPPQLRDAHVEVGEVVGVEDDSLRVALLVADPKAVAERRHYSS